MSKFLIYGANGWIGSMLVSLLQEQNHIVVCAKARLQNYEQLVQEITKIQPDYVLNTAGIVGIPNVDWCEEHKNETYQTNTIGIDNLAYACAHALTDRIIPLTNYATGCIYDDRVQLFTEQDEPNFTVSTYSHSKVLAEQLLQKYNHVLTLRIRLPISVDLHTKSLIAKLLKYKRVTNIANSMSYLPELLPISIRMTLDGQRGIYNFTNPGFITHVQILQLYQKYVDNSFQFEIINDAAHANIVKVPRCNCMLNVSKLTNLYLVNNIEQALTDLFTKL